MSRGRKTILALSTFALAAAVALGGGQMASADVGETPPAGELTSRTDGVQPQSGPAARVIGTPIELRGAYRIKNGRNTVTVKILDREGGPNVQVAISSLKLQRSSGGTWRTVASSADLDGWWATSDTASASVNCTPGSLYRAVYSAKYKGSAVHTGTVITSTWRCPS